MQPNESTKKITSNNPYGTELANYLREFHGINNPKRVFKCLNPEHDDQHPSMSINLKNNKCHCFACGKTMSIIDLVMIDQKIDYKGALLWLKNHYGEIKTENETVNRIFESEKKTTQNKSVEFLNKIYHSKYEPSETLINYLKGRGFKHAETIAKNNVIYEHEGNIFVPHFHYAEHGGMEITDYVVRQKAPDGKAKYIRSKGTSITHFDGGIDVLDAKLDFLEAIGLGHENNKIIVFISEGEFDALSYTDLFFDAKKEYANVGFPIFSTIGSSSVANASKVQKLIANLDKKVLENIIFILGNDHDDVGSNTDKSYEKFFYENNIIYIKNPLFNGYKDINERLQKDRENLLIDFTNFAKTVQTEYDKQKENKTIASLFEQNLIIDDGGYENGNIVIPFIHAIAFEIKRNPETGTIEPKLNEGKYPEKRVFYNSFTNKKYDNFSSLANLIKKKYFEEYTPENDVQIYLNSGTYTIPKQYSKHMNQIIKNMSQKEIFLNGDEEVYLDDFYTKFDEGKRRTTLIEVSDANKMTIAKMFINNGNNRLFSHFETQIDDYLNGYDKVPNGFKICDTTNVLKSIGIKNKQFVLSTSLFRELMKDETIPLEAIKAVQETFFEPLFIFDSKEENEIFIVSKKVFDDDKVLFFGINNILESPEIDIFAQELDEVSKTFDDALQENDLLYVDNSDEDLKTVYEINLPPNLSEKKEEILLKKSELLEQTSQNNHNNLGVPDISELDSVKDEKLF